MLSKPSLSPFPFFKLKIKKYLPLIKTKSEKTHNCKTNTYIYCSSQYLKYTFSLFSLNLIILRNSDF